MVCGVTFKVRSAAESRASVQTRKMPSSRKRRGRGRRSKGGSMRNNVHHGCDNAVNLCDEFATPANSRPSPSDTLVIQNEDSPAFLLLGYSRAGGHSRRRPGTESCAASDVGVARDREIF